MGTKVPSWAEHCFWPYSEGNPIIFILTLVLLSLFPPAAVLLLVWFVFRATTYNSRVFELTADDRLAAEKRENEIREQRLREEPHERLLIVKAKILMSSENHQEVFEFAESLTGPYWASNSDELYSLRFQLVERAARGGEVRAKVWLARQMISKEDFGGAESLLREAKSECEAIGAPFPGDELLADVSARNKKRKAQEKEVARRAEQARKEAESVYSLIQRCESPPERLFLEAVARTFHLKVKNGQLVGSITVALQVPIDRYRVDFLVNGNLIVEVDGREFHDTEDRFLKDRIRDQELAQLGYQTVRFAASQVMASPDAVAQSLERILSAR